MKIYKYQGVSDYYFDSLKNNKIYVPKPYELNDPMEGFIDKYLLGKSVEKKLLGNLSYSTRQELLALYKPSIWVQDIEQRLKDIKRYELLKQPLLSAVFEQIDYFNQFGIYSLTTDPFQELMWAHYSNSHKGFVIEYDSQILAPNKELLSVVYSNKLQEIGWEDLLIQSKNKQSAEQLDNKLTKLYQKIGLIKSLSWSYEKEQRYIFRNGELVDQKYYHYSPNAVTGIYFGLRMSEHHKTDLIDSLGKHVSFYQIENKLNSYELCSQKLMY